ncbi:MAG: AAA family ATPase [Nocardioides sp.]
MSDQRGRIVPGAGSRTEQIAKLIRDDIDAGLLRDGQALASTRELADQWGVSVFTITEAMKLLADQGLVESTARSRRVVRDRRPGPRTRPTLVIVGGFPGSGKTEFGRVLARRTGWAVLDKDSATRHVVEVALDAFGHSVGDRESPAYLERIRPTEYAALVATVIENLECGVSVIATAPFVDELVDEGWIASLDHTCAELDVTRRLVWMRCDIPTMHAYLAKRGAARDAAKLADWSAYSAHLDMAVCPAEPHDIVLNSTGDPALADQADALLKRWRRQ